MRKHLVITLLIFSLLISLFTTTYAWFTFIQRRSVATLTASELKFEVLVNQHDYQGLLQLDHLVFIDYEDDLIHNQSGLFNRLATTLRMEFKLDHQSPLSCVEIELAILEPAILYIIIFDGINIEDETFTSISYQELILTLIDPNLEKSKQRLALDDYNQSVLDYIASLTIYPSDVITITIALWGDYNALVDPSNYHDFTAQILLNIRAKSKVGGH